MYFVNWAGLFQYFYQNEWGLLPNTTISTKKQCRLKHQCNFMRENLTIGQSTKLYFAALLDLLIQGLQRLVASLQLVNIRQGLNLRLNLLEGSGIFLALPRFEPASVKVGQMFDAFDCPATPNTQKTNRSTCYFYPKNKGLFNSLVMRIGVRKA